MPQLLNPLGRITLGYSLYSDSQSSPGGLSSNHTQWFLVITQYLTAFPFLPYVLIVKQVSQAQLPNTVFVSNTLTLASLLSAHKVKHAESFEEFKIFYEHNRTSPMKCYQLEFSSIILNYPISMLITLCYMGQSSIHQCMHATNILCKHQVNRVAEKISPTEIRSLSKTNAAGKSLKGFFLLC